MEWSEFLKRKINVSDKLWICDYRFNNEYIKKPIRHIPPTKVVIDSNENTKKKIYYSDYHFKVLNNKDEPTSKIIAPYDNTGYRSFPGVALQVFYTEEGAKTYYRHRCEKIRDEAMKERDDILKQYDDFIERMKDNIESNTTMV